MTMLFVANGTYQTVVFHYRLPESTNLRTVQVARGKQVGIRDLSQADVDAVLKQNEKYGWARADTLDRMKTFVGVCYATDKPVPSKRIIYAMEHNSEVLKRRGQDNRQLAAIALTANIKKAVEDSQLGILREAEVMIVEEDQRGQSDHSLISESMTVADDVTRDKHGVETTKRQRPRKG